MLVLTVIMASWHIAALIFLIFYSIGKTTQMVLEKLDYNFFLLMIYTIVCILLVAVMLPYPIQEGDSTLLMILIYLTISVYSVVLILAQYDTFKSLVFWLSFLFLLVIFIIIYFFFTSSEHVKIFWVPFFILLSLQAVAGILVFFDIPQRFCKEIRITELYFQSHFWFQLVLLILLIEI